MQYLINHEPFDQSNVVAVLQAMLETIPGWNLRGGMKGRPSVQLDELKTEDQRQSLLKVLDWIYDKFTTWSAAT